MKVVISANQLDFKSNNSAEAHYDRWVAGGNAVDIAVGSALAATVSEALMCSLGGSAFIAIKLPGAAAELIDGADAMPRIPPSVIGDPTRVWKQAAIPYGDGISVNVGHASIAVPGMLRALELAWQRHGSLPWRDLLGPAIALAKTGVGANQTLVKWRSLSHRYLISGRYCIAGGRDRTPGY